MHVSLPDFLLCLANHPVVLQHLCSPLYHYLPKLKTAFLYKVHLFDAAKLKPGCYALDVQGAVPEHVDDLIHDRRRHYR